MDKQNSPLNSPRETIIKLKLLDIFPSIIELEQQQNEISIIFQGLDTFYNLYDLLKTKTEITLNAKTKSSIIISLIKCDNIFATSIFNIKQGEQWITFSYENKKKKELSFVQSLIDCIKIRLNCEFDKNISNIILNAKKINHNVKNNYLKQNSYYSSLTTEENFKIPNKINKMHSNNYFKNISMEATSKEKFQEKEKYSCIKSLNRIKTNKNYNKITYDDLTFRLNKLIDINNTKEESKLNLTQRHKKNNESNNNLNLLKKSDMNLSVQYKDNKISKQVIKNKILKTNTYNNELISGKKTKNKSKNNKEKIKDNLENILNKNNAKTPVVTKINNFQNDKKLLKENKNKNKQIPQYIHSTLMEYNNKNKIEDEKNNGLLNNNENNGYEKLKEEFNLLYNDYHIKNIQKDLLKLEIEIFIEKMIGLISAYNFDINEKKLNNKILIKKIKVNRNEYFKIKKLDYNLKLMEEKYKNDILNKNEKNIKLINNKEIEINKKEIELFNLLYPTSNKTDKDEETNKNNINYINKKEELKSILNIILSKSKNKNIFIKENLNKKLNGIIKLNLIEEKNNYKYIKPNARARIIPKFQQNQFNNKIAKNKIIEQNLNEEERKEDFNSTEQNSRVESFYNPKKAYSKKTAK